MANIKVKRSAVPGKVPLVGDLALGEFAVNTHDGKVYTKKNVDGIETIVTVNPDGVALQNLQNRYSYTVSSSAQGTFAASYVVPYVDVYQNGSRLATGDYIATDGSSVVLAVAAQPGDVVEIVALNSYTANSDFLNVPGGIATADFLKFDVAATNTPEVAKLNWNADEGTLEFGLKGGQVVLQVGQEQVQRIYNGTGSTLVSGQVVYVTGSQGNRLTVALASASSEATSTRTFGVVTETILNEAEGFITTSGLVRGLDTSAFAEGSVLWLGTSAGTYTTTRPTAPNHGVLVGFVVRQHASVGSVFVHVANGYELNELHDVLISSKQDGQALVYEAATGLWKNKFVDYNTLLNKPTLVTQTDINNAVSTKQDTLVSGTNIKTVNGTSILGSGNIQIDGGVVSFNTRTGAVTLSSSDVTTALGYTPYNSTNPSGYITSSSSITGNAATATALQTARTINGVSFDGTANITVADSTKLPLSGGNLTGTLNTYGGDSAILFRSYNASASNAAQFYIEHNLGGVDIGNSRGSINFDSAVNISTATNLSFGNQTRQMINLYNTDYGIGIQSGTQYYRSNTRFSWFRGGSHNDAENNAGGGTVAMTLDGSSNLSVTGGIYSQIFYDSNDTGYYVDPNSTSRQYRINTVNGINFGGTFALTGSGASIDNSIGTRFSENYGVLWNMGDSATWHHQVINGSMLCGFQANGNNWGSGKIVANSDMRSPIYYDYNDTAYYIDPNDTTRLSRIIADRGLGNSGGHHVFGANISTAVPTWNNTQVEIRNTDAGNVGIAFHRSGYTVSSIYHDGGSNIRVTGDFIAGGNVTAYSDIRKKTNISIIENALEKVRCLRGVVYDRIDLEYNSRQTGVIAQEVLKVLPEAVIGTEDTEYAVAYGNMVGLLIEAIKEQDKKIKRLEALVEKLLGETK